MNRLLDFFKNLKYRKKLFISYIFVVTIPLLVLGTYSYNISKNYLFTQAKMSLDENVKKVVANINYKIERYNSVISTIAYNPKIVQILNIKYSNLYNFYSVVQDTLDPIISNIKPLNDEILQVMIYTGNAVAKQTSSISYIKPIEDAFYKQITSKDTIQNWVIMDGKLYSFRKFIELRNSKIENAISIELNIKSLFGDSLSYGFKNSGIVISDRDNNIIYEKDNILEKDLLIDKNILITINEEIVKSGNTEYLVIKKTISEPEWTVCYYVPLESLNIDAKKIMFATFIIISICLVVLIFIIWLFSKTFVKRISELNKKMKLIEEGNLKIEISSSSRDEIGELANGFGNMLKSINLLINEVYNDKIVLKETEMKALQAQINPHFLYNTLSLINWKAIRIKATDISHITTTISKYYRTALNRGKNLISIADELENTKAYIEIQSIMHDYSFEVNYSIDPELLKYNMINLILQPIVENAIEHGIDRRPEGGGRLYLTGIPGDETIEFIIGDNGPGMSEETIQQVLIDESKGYGLKNVCERIKLFFGNEYGLTIKSKLGAGTQVSILIKKFLN